MRKNYDAMRASIIEATSLVEALIDFGEDEGISEGVFGQGESPIASFLPLELIILCPPQQGTRLHLFETGLSGSWPTIDGAKSFARASTWPSSELPMLGRVVC